MEVVLQRPPPGSVCSKRVGHFIPEFPTSVLSTIYFIVICEKFVKQSCPLFFRRRVTAPATREHWEYTNASQKGVTSPDSRCSWLVGAPRRHERLARHFLGQQKRRDKRRALLIRRFRKRVEPSRAFEVRGRVGRSNRSPFVSIRSVGCERQPPSTAPTGGQ